MNQDGKIRIVTINTKQINNKSRYYDDIKQLLHSHRGHGYPEDLANEPLNKLKMLMYNGKIVSVIRYGIKQIDGEPMYYINLVHTLADYRRRGFSKKLFATLFSRISLRSCLEVDPKNKNAIDMYKQLGFKMVKKQLSDEFITMIR